MNNNKHKILVIEDEQNISNFVKTILETNDYQVLTAKTGQEGKTMGLSHNPDLIILDLGLPDLDGCSLIEIFREKSNLPIIVLSARTGESDKVKALDLGANDYITKPFSPSELMARVDSVYRRVALNNQTKMQPSRIDKITLEPFELNLRNRTLYKNGVQIELTQVEFQIIEFFFTNAGNASNMDIAISTGLTFPFSSTVDRF